MHRIPQLFCAIQSMHKFAHHVEMVYYKVSTLAAFGFCQRKEEVPDPIRKKYAALVESLDNTSLTKLCNGALRYNH